MPDPTERLNHKAQYFFPLLLALVALAVIYAPTMQTIPNGSSQDYMVDVGEMQIALNVWGTLHPTGYPLYTLLASLLTHLFTALGVTPALAPGLASLTFGFAAVSLLYALLVRLSGRPWLAGAAILLLGLARSWWMHHTIAEIYTFSMLLLLILLALALWPTAWSTRKRVWLLALVGGIAGFHHRILILTAPALLVAVWPSLRAEMKTRGLSPLSRPLLPLIAVALGFGLLGGLQYLYLPLRDWAGGDWVYGRPGTWAGFQQVFTGFEYNYLLAERPAGLGGIMENLGHALGILATEISAPGLVLSAGALGALLLWPNRHRRTASILALIALPFLAWVAVLYRSVLAEAVLMPVTLVLVAAVVLAGDVVLRQFDETTVGARHAVPLQWIGRIMGGQGQGRVMTLAVVIWAALLIPAQGPFIQALTHDDNGLRMIALAESIPRAADAAPDPAFVVPWGADHFAVAYGQRLLGRNTDLRLVDHTADFRALYAGGHLVLTRPVTFFVFIPEFWAEWFGVDQVYIYGYTPELVEVRPEPRILPDPPPPLSEVTAGIVLQAAALRCEADPAAHLTGDPAGADSVVVDLTWAAREHPDRDLSTFVHLIGAERGDLLAPPGGSDHPAGGWRPTSDWLAGEQVRDLYRLPRVAGAQAVVVGMYAQAADGTFVNYGETTISLEACAN